ncbi:hypothetical protein X801_08115, partial [Opisthorchis viverrini]
HELQEGHLSGGPGYVISREAFKTIVDKAIGTHPACPTYDENKEDLREFPPILQSSYVRQRCRSEARSSGRSSHNISLHLETGTTNRVPVSVAWTATLTRPSISAQ